MSLTVAQRQRAVGLYKRLLRTSRKTFDGDAVAIAAARDETRRRFKEAAKETDATKIDEGLKMGDEIVSVLRQNVVQGKWRQEREAYELRMTKDTELGNNDSIKEARAKQIADLKAGKKPERKSCREMAAQYQAASASTSSLGASSSSSTPRQVRAYSTVSSRPTSTILAQATSFQSQRSGFASSATASSRDPSAASQAPLPRPVPKFTSTTVLADGSSIQLATTSPRRLTRLTRDPTNHPLWNPGQERKVGGDADDDSGRLGRFRRRFQEAEAAAAGDGKAQPQSSGDVKFGQEDLDWMSVGGREARAGSPIAAKKSAKGKGRK